MMTAALKWQGVPAYVIAMGRGVSAIIGIMATLVYPIAHSWILTLRTGLWSIWAQVKSKVKLFNHPKKGKKRKCGLSDG